MGKQQGQSGERGRGACGQKSSLQFLQDGTGEAGCCRTKYIERGKHYLRSEKTSFLDLAWLLSQCVPSAESQHTSGLWCSQSHKEGVGLSLRTLEIP